MIIGPADTPFEDGTFRLVMQFEEQYPNKPPQVKFISQMFHPNVYATGELCLDILQNRWSPTYDVAAVLTSIQRYGWLQRPRICDRETENGVTDTRQQFAQRPEHRITGERGGVEPIQRQPQGIHEESTRDGGEELGGLSDNDGGYRKWVDKGIQLPSGASARWFAPLMVGS